MRHWRIIGKLWSSWGIARGFGPVVLLTGSTLPALAENANRVRDLRLELGAQSSLPDDVHWWDGFGQLGMDYHVDVLGEYNTDLIAGGGFFNAGGVHALTIARWDGQGWNALGGGLDHEHLPGPEYNPWALALAIYRGDLIAGGSFTKADGRPANYVASWNGTSWSALGPGLNHHVFALAVFHGDLIAGGDFTEAGTQTVNYIARWDGTSWHPVGSGFDGVVYRLAVYDDVLIAGGDFAHAGGTPTNLLARWDGSSWNDFGSALHPASIIRSLVVFDSGLVVGGSLGLSSGVPVNGLSWDGSTWSPLGGGLTGSISALGVYNNNLIVGGAVRIEGVPSEIARWDGTAWHPLGTGLNDGVGALLEHDGSLFVGGAFTTAGGKPSRYVARWDDRITPIEVENLQATVVQGTVQLAWGLSRQAQRALTGVRVQRADALLGPYNDRMVSPLAPEGIMSFTDADVESGHRYWYRLVLLGWDGEGGTSGPIGVAVGTSESARTMLAAAIPQDGAAIEIHYSVGGRVRTPVCLEVFDVMGRLLAVLDHGVHDPGEHTRLWDRRDEYGTRVVRGVYLVRLTAGDTTLSKKLVLVRN